LHWFELQLLDCFWLVCGYWFLLVAGSDFSFSSTVMHFQLPSVPVLVILGWFCYIAVLHGQNFWCGEVSSSFYFIGFRFLMYCGLVFRIFPAPCNFPVVLVWCVLRRQVLINLAQGDQDQNCSNIMIFSLLR